MITKKLKAIARDWRVKLAVQNTLSLIPGNAGFRMNELLTQFVRGGMDERQDLPVRFRKGLDNLALISSNIDGFTVKDKTVLELGTGWHGVDLVIFHLLGAKGTITIDHHAHLTLDNLVLSIRAMLSDRGVLNRLDEFEGASQKVRSLEASIEQVDSLSKLLGLLCVDYKIVTSAEYKNLRLGQQPVDLFYSESVLQRIPEHHLRDLLGVVNDSMSDAGVIFQRTDQKDINAQQHVDTGLWALDYLRHSERAFKLFLSSRFNSQNRLRESDFLQLFEDAGLPPVYVESYCRKADVERLQTFKVAKRFEDKTIEDLAITLSKIICRKGPLSPPADLKRSVTYR